MSTTITAPTTTDVEWTETDAVKSAVWIGRYRGVFIGMVEHREPEGFTATTHRGRGLGNFPTLEDAQHSFYKV
ncbi:hypothetical protein EYE40_09910 [Glaciihabitans arcticus]|uniref:Uncharacterized protein n=1 Tax=Glaciihabitans arcticus TaxID=2668039 RepID=A0A4Q9GRS9_9MICO|nr:hypothetical protein [Glaciihabitans arcticus]TBN57676.1 hypothetical protein EYE40_09910 [Glaciihabitans arcticus]